MKAIATLLFSFFLIASSVKAEEPFVTYSSESSFADVMEMLKLAIEERGMFINNIMHMDEMLERTGHDLGITDQLYIKASSIEFCSAILSRKMIQGNPNRIINCPFIMSVYVLPSEPETTYIAHRYLDDDTDDGVMAEVREMLQAVAEAGQEAW